jgi:hypothetical protein
MEFTDLQAVFLASYAEHPKARTTSLRNWCRKLMLRIPSASLAELTLQALMRMPLEHLKSQDCHDPQEFDTLTYVLSRVLSELDKTLVVKPQAVQLDAGSVSAPATGDLPDAPAAPAFRTIDDVGQEVADPHRGTSLEERFVSLQRWLVDNPSAEILTTELREWLEPHDQHIPLDLLSVPAEDILRMSFAGISKRWAGDARLKTLLQMLERATRAQVQSSAHGPTETTLPTVAALQTRSVDEDRYTLTAGSWDRWRRLIQLRDAGNITVAQAADSLRHIHSTAILHKPIRTFTECSLRQLEQRYAHGSAEYVGIVSAVRNLAEALTHFRIAENGTWQFLHANLRSVRLWLEQQLCSGKLPTADELMIWLWRPITWQLRNDLPPRLATVALMRLRDNVSGSESTLESVAQHLGVSKARVYQLGRNAVGTLESRWPALVDHLMRLRTKLYSAGSTEAGGIVDLLLTRCFAETVDTECSLGSRSTVVQQWEEAGRQRMTPMDDREIALWGASRFQNLSPQRVIDWIQEIAVSCTTDEGQTLRFTRLPLDCLLSRLCSEIISLPLADAASSVGVDTRTLIARLERDLRFVVTDDGLVTWSERCEIKRFDDSWKLRLSSQRWISIEVIVDATIMRLTSAGIHDATIWGVHRCVSEYLKAATGDGLPQQLTPIVLANVLVLNSDGRIRHMRRRRLRWDHPAGAHVARGKSGWVGHVVSLKGIPVTLDELSGLLQEFYQDYPFHVVQQINLAADEDGEFDERVRFIEGTRRRLPALLVPTHWTLNPDCSNVSPGILRHAKRLRRLLLEKLMDATEFRHVPWLLKIVRSEFLSGLNLAEEADPEDVANGELNDDDSSRPSPDAAGDVSVDESPAPAAVDAPKVAAVSRPVLRQKALPGLFSFRTRHELQSLHHAESESALFNASLDEPLVDLIGYVFGRIAERAAPLRRPCSLVELRLTSPDYTWLCQLIAKLSPDEMMVFRRVENRFPDYSFDAQIGAILMLVIAETGRRFAIEGELWAPVFRNAPWHPETKAFLFNGNQPHARHRRMLESAAVELDLRRAFGEDSVQEGYQSIFLQFGFSRRGLEHQLSNWLSEQNLSSTIIRLRDDPRHQSATFTALWRKLAGYRHGTESRGDLLRFLEDSPWVLSDWHEAITQACRPRAGAVEDTEHAIRSETVPEPSVTKVLPDAGFLRAPRLDADRLRQAQPCVEFRAAVGDLSNAALVADIYRIEISGHSPVVLVKQSDGRYVASSGELRLLPVAPRLQASLVAPSGEVVDTQTIELWDSDDEVTAYSTDDGRRINAWGKGLSVPGLLLIYSADLLIEPETAALARGLLAGNLYRYCVFDRGALPSAKLSLGREILWTPLLKPESAWIQSITIESALSPRNDPRTISIRVRHSPDVKVTGIRFHGLLHECWQQREGLSECRPLEIPDAVRGRDMVFVTILAKFGDETGHRRVGVSVRPEAHLWRRNGPWEILRTNVRVDATESRNAQYRLWLPEPSVPDHTWHVFEGMQWIAPASPRVQRLLELSGWGAPLFLRTGPYNSRDKEIQVLAEVTDMGVLREVTFDPQGLIRLSLRTRIAPGAHHSVVLLTSVGEVVRIGHAAIVVGQQHGSAGSTDEWIVDPRQGSVASELIVAVGVAYEGERLGSWWTENWADVLCEPAGENRNLSDTTYLRIAESIRWFHLPLLSSGNLRCVRDFAFRHTAAILCSWLGQRPGQEFACTETGESWNCVVREIFADWEPTPTAAVEIDSALEAGAEAGHPVLWVSLQAFNQISPLVAARFAKQWLKAMSVGRSAQTNQRAALIDLLRKKLLAGSEGNATAFEERMVRNIARDVSMSNLITEGTCDFVRDGLIEPAVRLLHAETAAELAEWDRGNVAVAMKLPDYRTLVLFRCLKAIEESI